MTDIILKPCPFCGSSRINNRYWEFANQYYIECNECNAKINFNEDIDDTIKQWNKRANIKLENKNIISKNIFKAPYEE